LFKKGLIWKVVLILCFFILVAAIVFYPQIRRVYQVMTLFESENIVENFRSMDQIFNSKTVQRGDEVNVLKNIAGQLPETYYYKGEEKSIQDFLEETWTTGFIILKDGQIFYEEYFLGNEEDTKVISWSVSKSLVSALVGIAVHDGYINDIGEPVTKYVPSLHDSGYSEVPIKDILQMSSGIHFNEDYADFYSDINRMGRALAFDTSIDAFVLSLDSERKPGTYNNYVSMDTQVLGMLLREATGQSLTEYMEEELWSKTGMEADAYWLLDSQGMELAFGGLNAVLRDYARFGLLYMNEGNYKGEQIVPAGWVEDSVTPDAPHLMPGRTGPDQEKLMGYGYQWWLPADTDGDFMAIGIYNQYIWVHPESRVVIAKSSAYPDYDLDGTLKTVETIAMFRSIAEDITEQ